MCVPDWSVLLTVKLRDIPVLAGLTIVQHYCATISHHALMPFNPILSALQSAGFNPEPGAAGCEGRSEPCHEGTASSRHIQHHAGHALSGQHACPHCPPRLPGTAGQHPAAAATGPPQ